MKKKLQLIKEMSKYLFYGIVMQTLFFSVLLAHEGDAQNNFGKSEVSMNLKEVSLHINLKKASIKDLFDEIEKTSGFKFFYDKEVLNSRSRYTFNEELSLYDLLVELSRESNLHFKQVNKNINVKSIRKEEIAEVVYQAISVSGKVTSDDSPEGLPGVNVVVKGTAQGTVTDVEGNYQINVPSSESVLVYSSVGYVMEEITVGEQGVINVTMVSDITSLSEVVVVGYGTQKRSDITGSVASVPKERLSNLPVTNVMYALQGSTAGLNISQASSVPGREGSISIRGNNSINASTEPLYVLDGVIFFGTTNDINPNDIESIEILKDASAVAIYGTRGSNGVILITTKRGKTGKPTVSYNGYYGIEDIPNVLTPMGPDAYVQKYADYKEATNRDDPNVLPNDFEIQNYNAGITTDWIDVATQTGKIQDHNLSLTGGTEDAKYYVNLGYLDQQGVVKGYQYKRFNFRTNVDIKPTNFLNVGTSIFYTNKNLDGGRINLLNATAMSPYSKPYKDDGTIEIFPMSPELLFVNPLTDLGIDRIDRGNNLNGNAYLEVVPGFLKGLKYRLQGSYALQFEKYRDYAGRQSNNNAGRAEIFDNQSDSWVLENLLTYSKDFGKHHIDFTGLYSAQGNDYFESRIIANGFVNDQLLYNNIEAGTSAEWNSEANDTYTLVSQMARINYSYDERYLISLTTRRDGYSAFGEDANKFAVFPSVALGWNIHNESFIRQSDVLNQLKLRGSYGKTGNQAIDPTQTRTKASSTSLAMGGALQNGVILDDLVGNSLLRWESTTQTNMGIDFGVLRNRITGTVEVFKSRTTDILLRRNLPRATGSREMWDNLGEVENKGLEFTLKTLNVETGGFKWESDLNFSTFRNKIIDLYGDKQDDVGNRWFIGEPLGVIFDYEMLGVWQEDEDPSGSDPSAQPGDLKFKDQNTVDTDGDGIPDAPDGVINADDRVILGQTAPKWYGGITNTFHYKNFHLSIFIQTSQGAMRNNVDRSYADERGRRNIPEDVGYWTPENRSNEWPGLAYTNPRGYGYPRDNSFTRIKDITLSYTFPQELVGRAGIGSLTAYVAGRNLYTFTNDWVGWDPESRQIPRGSTDAASNDSWVNNYPYVRTIVFGLNLSL